MYLLSATLYRRPAHEAHEGLAGQWFRLDRSAEWAGLMEAGSKKREGAGLGVEPPTNFEPTGEGVGRSKYRVEIRPLYGRRKACAASCPLFEQSVQKSSVF